MKLHDINSDIEKLLDSDDSELINDNLESMELAFNEKALELVKYTKNIDSDIDQLKLMKKEIESKIKTLENKRDSFRDYVLHNMNQREITKISCPLFNISIRKPVDKIEIVDEEMIPDEFCSVEVVTKIDKKSLLKAAKDAPIDGARIVKGKESLIIK
jgi:hypothetical protein